MWPLKCSLSKVILLQLYRLLVLIVKKRPHYRQVLKILFTVHFSQVFQTKPDTVHAAFHILHIPHIQYSQYSIFSTFPILHILHIPYSPYPISHIPYSWHPGGTPYSRCFLFPLLIQTASQIKKGKWRHPDPGCVKMWKTCFSSVSKLAPHSQKKSGP